jgi:hypothetical protein
MRNSVMSDDPIHIVEPTLTDETGHCYSFVSSLCQAERGGQFSLWVARNASLRGFDGTCDTIRYFRRRIRRVQSYFLYRRLLRDEGRIFIPTAGTMDLFLLDLAAKGVIPGKKVYLFFHWVRRTPAKERRLSLFASKQPNTVILGPTPEVMDFFRQCGFEETHLVAYPITRRNDVGSLSGPFRHLIFAGAARIDKGFSHAVDLVGHLAAIGSTVPVNIQISSSHYRKCDPAVKREIERLRSLSFPPLSIVSGTLDTQSYLDLFRGGICLQPYDRHDFADRISGVTLDALSAGCPVVTISGTWMARVISRFEAGIVAESAAPEVLLASVESILSDYRRFQYNAYQAGRTLQTENDAVKLIHILRS